MFAEPVSRRTFPQLQAVADDITAAARPPWPPSSRIRTRPGWDGGWCSPPTRPTARSARHAPTPLSSTTLEGCSRRAGPPC
ncbi:xanthine dehydrogenase domain protein [Mycobacterium xenopi 4042]|uniref:Xanthine dehydrogenase domain protein n=1 Tax=Mycobacterium xenopi 4042 TaxID=1299334 RepID=X8DKK0_MYCXE|nr:xanthine dehydrogenase domain protein [Mycobacterium xenopi 4042]